jgi:hypothetical protein
MAVLLDQTEYLREHYGYELWMLRELHNRMVEPQVFHAFDFVIRNACIEAFCVHARALIDFFATQPSGKNRSTDVVADLFCPGFSTAIDGGSAAFKVKVNKQIAHLTQERASPIKVNGIDFAIVRTTIETQHRRFHASLSLALAEIVPPPDDRFSP